MSCLTRALQAASEVSSPSDSCLTLTSLCLLEHLPIFRSGQLSLQNSNHFFVLAILSQALHVVVSSFSLPMLGFWSVRNEIEDKHSKTTMNLCDLNQTQEAGKAHAVLGLLFFFSPQKLGSVQMGSICTYSLPPKPFGKAHGISTCILHSCYSSPLLMWFALNSLKVVYVDTVLTTRHPPTLGCISTTCQPETQGRRQWAPAHSGSSNPIPSSHVWFWKTLFKRRKKSWGERTQKDHHSRARLGEESRLLKGFCNLTWRLHHVWKHVVCLQWGIIQA